MDITHSELNTKMDRPAYYEDLGRAHDCLLRCKDCQKLVTFDAITKMGMCDGCGNRRFVEIKILNEAEMEDIRTGKIDFPDWQLFLAEFEAVSEEPKRLVEAWSLRRWLRSVWIAVREELSWKRR